MEREEVINIHEIRKIAKEKEEELIDKELKGINEIIRKAAEKGKKLRFC